MEDAWKWKNNQDGWRHEGINPYPPLEGHHSVAEEDGSKYEGNWVDNKKTGRGKMVWAAVLSRHLPTAHSPRTPKPPPAARFFA